MAEEKKTSIFRQETLERISSPEQLTDYLRVTTPGLWVIFGAIVAMLIGFFTWMQLEALECGAASTSRAFWCSGCI